MTRVAAEDLYSWRDPDELLDALYKLGEARGQSAPDNVRSAVTALLDHEDEDLRQEALRLLLLQWKDTTLRDRTCEMLRLDPSEAVRATAAFGIASVSAADTRNEDTQTLLEAVLNVSQPPHVRGAAYEGLLIIYRRTRFPPLARDIKPSTDIDWNWIGELRSEVSSADE